MRRILIVEDDPAQRYLFSLLLSRLGYESSFAEHGERALELLAHGEQFDLILTDINMPVMGGEQLVKEVHQFYPTLPVVVMTVRSEKDMAVETLRRHSMAYLPKPFDRDQLKAAIRSAICGPVNH